MKTSILVGLLLTGLGSHAQTQKSHKVVQFTGLVVSGDSLVGVPYIAIYVPKTTRHTTANAAGYFSLPVLAGDSIVFRSPNYITHVIIPADYSHQSYSLLVQLTQNAVAVRVLPASFVSNFLSLRLPAERTFEAPDGPNKTIRKYIFQKMATKK